MDSRIGLIDQSVAGIPQAERTAPAKAALKRGGRLGKYRLAGKLGTGGFCEVWKARDTLEGIWVALKIPQTGTNGQAQNQTLLHEVRLVARLRHRHIMPVKNADIIDGRAVLATELSVGTLADRAKPMAVRRIVGITAQVLDGLAYAHRERLVHCDVTPGNIFLFPDGRAALGDFGISLHLKGRMVTIEEYGTPGYVAPEQAYGRPTYRSDCFSVGLLLYEYLTGVLPRWPFKWPFRGVERLRDRTSGPLVSFVRRAMSVDPAKRFANAGQMLTALSKAAPKLLTAHVARKQPADWRKVRRTGFVDRYRRVFPILAHCVDCGEPIAESMIVCPWCRSRRNRFDTRSRFSYVCLRCHKGVLAEWRYCPWCYGPGFATVSSVASAAAHYHARCRFCDGKLMRFMRYCPWCHRKVRKPWRVHPFGEICTTCRWSVDSNFWNYCPWCVQRLIP